jgi:hypothetical protein
MGRSKTGTVEILWPGGIRNKLFGVRAGERITFPEIPCSYAAASMSLPGYAPCVHRSLHALVHHGELSRAMAARFASSALRAFRQAHPRS